MKVLAELLNAKPREIRSFLSGHLAPGRTQELQSELLAAGSLFRRPQNQTANLLDRRIVKMDLQVVEAGDSRQAKLEALSSLRLNSAAEHVCGVMQHGDPVPVQFEGCSEERLHAGAKSVTLRGTKRMLV